MRNEPYIPSLAEIDNATEKIRAGWSDRDHMLRAGYIMQAHGEIMRILPVRTVSIGVQDGRRRLGKDVD